MFQQITLINYRRPLPARAKARKTCGPYKWTPTPAGSGRGFYSESENALTMAQHGAGLRLRLECANDHLHSSRQSDIRGYFTDSDCDGDTLQPIIARLPHGRGFLAGYTMGAGMCGTLEPEIYDDEESAAFAAHSVAEYTAEKECDYRESHTCTECGEWFDDDDDELEDGVCAACRGDLEGLEGDSI